MCDFHAKQNGITIVNPCGFQMQTIIDLSHGSGEVDPDQLFGLYKCFRGSVSHVAQRFKQGFINNDY